MIQTIVPLNSQVWLYEIGMGFLIYPVEKICDDNGEDPDCSRYGVTLFYIWNNIIRMYLHNYRNSIISMMV